MGITKGRNKAFSSQAMSHYHKLRYCAFGASSLKPIFLFFFSIKKLILSLNTSNLYKLQTFFLIKAVLPPICWRVFLAMNLLTCLPCHQFVDVSALPPICWCVFLATNLLTCLPCHQFIDVSSLPSICWRVFLAINLLTCLPCHQFVDVSSLVALTFTWHLSDQG